MAASIRYRGLCETCDRDATCTLKRSSRLEIIHCEQYSTQPVVKNKNPVPAAVSSAETADHCKPAIGIERN